DGNGWTFPRELFLPQTIYVAVPPPQAREGATVLVRIDFDVAADKLTFRHLVLRPRFAGAAHYAPDRWIARIHALDENRRPRTFVDGESVACEAGHTLQNTRTTVSGHGVSVSLSEREL